NPSPRTSTSTLSTPSERRQRTPVSPRQPQRRGTARVARTPGHEGPPEVCPAILGYEKDQVRPSRSRGGPASGGGGAGSNPAGAPFPTCDDVEITPLPRAPVPGVDRPAVEVRRVDDVEQPLHASAQDDPDV